MMKLLSDNFFSIKKNISSLSSFICYEQIRPDSVTANLLGALSCVQIILKWIYVLVLWEMPETHPVSPAKEYELLADYEYFLFQYDFQPTKRVKQFWLEPKYPGIFFYMIILANPFTFTYLSKRNHDSKIFDHHPFLSCTWSSTAFKNCEH